MAIRQLTIQRYRGLEKFEWCPAPGVNALIGPGDVGKTTVLQAISLLFNTAPSGSASEYDYYDRNVEDGFEISAVIGDLSETLRRNYPTALRGWKDNQLHGLPDEDGAEAVILVSVRGNNDLEIFHEVVFSDDTRVWFSVASRRTLNFSNLASGARAMTEFRLSRGSLLDRHIKGSKLRLIVTEKMAAASADIDLPEDIAESLEQLKKRFKTMGLPDGLHLGLITPQERSLLWLVGLLTGDKPEHAVPLAFSGSGTTQLAMFALASALAKGEPIVVVDEPEVGLEPYRQRALIRSLVRLAGATGQVFITTHSPAILSVLTGAQLARIMPGVNPQTLTGVEIDRLLREAPSAFVSMLPVLCEGETEAGFLAEVLDLYAKKEGLEGLDALGVTLVAREGIPIGQPRVLHEATALLNVGIACGLFVDNEASFAGLRDQLRQRDDCAFGCWDTVVNIEEAVAMSLPIEQMSKLVDLAARLLQRGRPESLLQQVGEYAGEPGKASIDALVASLGEKTVRNALSKAMQQGIWFKQMERARALGKFLLEEGMPSDMEKVLVAFWESIKKVLYGAK